MITLTLNIEPVAVEIFINDDELIVHLADGRSLSIPLVWYPRLWHGTKAERENWQLLGGGYAIEWPDLDEHIGIQGLLPRRSPKRRKSHIPPKLAQPEKITNCERNYSVIGGARHLQSPLIRQFPLNKVPGTCTITIE